MFFARSFERLSGYSDGKVSYSCDIMENGPTIDSASDLSLGNTNKLEKTVEFHSSDCIRIPLPSEH